MKRIFLITFMAVMMGMSAVPAGAVSGGKAAAGKEAQIAEAQDLMAQLEELSRMEQILKEEEARFQERQLAQAAPEGVSKTSFPSAEPEVAQDFSSADSTAESVEDAAEPSVVTEPAAASTQNFSPRSDALEPEAAAPRMDKTCVTAVCPTPAPVEYWDTDVRKQTLEEIQGHQKIDQVYKQARAIVLPETPYQGQEAQAAPEIITPADILRHTIPAEYLTQTLDLNFDDTSLSDIVLTLGESGHLNIVLDPALKNSKLDLHLKGVTIEEALLLMANSYDLGFKKVGSSLYITPQEKLREQNTISRVFKVKNINVAEAKALIKDVVKTVNVSDAINSLIVVGQPEDIIEVEKILARIDHPQPQVVLEANIVEVNKDALKDLGVDWADQLNVQFQESGRPQDFDNVEDAPDSPFKMFALSRTPLQFSNLVKILENQNKAKVLSNPRVTTLNDKEAEIFVGDRIPYTVTTISGGVATSDVRFEEPGIRLTITPSIIGEDFVVIKVEPEVSYIFSFRGPDDQYPWVKKRNATAYVRVKNNQPFVLGGLLNQEDKHNLAKVPLLGNMPLLGNLFSYDKKTVQDTELIITITPTIVYQAE